MSPARARELSGLPPAVVILGTEDPFCTEGLRYAMRLHDAEVPVELHQYIGGTHGFDVHRRHSSDAHALDAQIDAVRRLFDARQTALVQR
ncbi:MAG: alpha/beta hydrolase fold domain-containing protein [Pseudonocardiales bacterium]|nr:alpha/beta hydrolase fold domain-containing protein [Pseudonocardiales bacterium]